jgi:hypothetical protein
MKIFSAIVLIDSYRELINATRDSLFDKSSIYKLIQYKFGISDPTENTTIIERLIEEQYGTMADSELLKFYNSQRCANMLIYLNMAYSVIKDAAESAKPLDDVVPATIGLPTRFRSVSPQTETAMSKITDFLQYSYMAGKRERELFSMCDALSLQILTDATLLYARYQTPRHTGIEFCRCVINFFEQTARAQLIDDRMPTLIRLFNIISHLACVQTRVTIDNKDIADTSLAALGEEIKISNETLSAIPALSYEMVANLTEPTFTTVNGLRYIIRTQRFVVKTPTR